MTRVFIWKNNSPQEWEEISFSAFSKARRNGCFTGRFFVETVKMFRDEDDRIIMECSRKDFEKYQQEDRHSRYLQEHEKSRSIFPASHVGDRDGTEEGYQDTDLFVDESVDTAEQAIQNLLLEDLHQALLKLSPAERNFILSYYEMKIPNATCLAKRNAQRLEEAFYSSKTPDPVEDTEPETADTAVTESDESDAAKILELLKNPETAALLKQLAKAL